MPTQVVWRGTGCRISANTRIGGLATNSQLLGMLRGLWDYPPGLAFLAPTSADIEGNVLLFFIRFERGMYVGCNSLTIGEHITPTSHGSISGLEPFRLIGCLASGDQSVKFRRSVSCDERRHITFDCANERPSASSRGILRLWRMWSRPYFLEMVRMR